MGTTFSFALKTSPKGSLVVYPGINWNPGQNTVTEILQNVYTLILTPIGSQVLNRRLGVDMRYVDKPIHTAIALVRFALTISIQAWEPRFKVTDISFDRSQGLNGVVQCTVTGEIDTVLTNPFANVLTIS